MSQMLVTLSKPDKDGNRTIRVNRGTRSRGAKDLARETVKLGSDIEGNRQILRQAVAKALRDAGYVVTPEGTAGVGG